MIYLYVVGLLAFYAWMVEDGNQPFTSALASTLWPVWMIAIIYKAITQ